MHATSRATLEEVRTQFWVTATTGDGFALAQELAQIIDVLDDNPALRRALTDPSLTSENKQGLANDVFKDASAPVRGLMAQLAAGRWSEDTDLPDAVENLAVTAGMADAEKRGTLPAVEEQLSKICALVDEHPDLRTLVDRHDAIDEASATMQQLLGDQVDQVTAALVDRVIRHPRGRRVVPSLQAIEDRIAEHRAQLIATVTSAIDLTQDQMNRLDGLLERAYGCEVTVYVNVEPEVVGGLRLEVGSDVIDATVLSRLAEARRYLTSQEIR